MINVKFKKLYDDVKLPVKATDGSAAYDLYTPDYCVIPEGRSIVKLGFSMAMPYGIQAQVEPRSGYSSKGFEAIYTGLTMKDIVLINCKKVIDDRKSLVIPMDRVDADVIVGKVDSDYRGIVGVIINNRSGSCLILDKHQRIAQMTFQKVEDVNFEEVTELDETSRNGGFGHSGSKEIKN